MPLPGPRLPKVVRRPVHGVLLLDKPLGMSSNAALQRAKRLYRAEKAGHTGTLDPLASGLLPLAFGAATKFAHAALDADKRYLATLRCGVVTTTGDAEGEVVERREAALTAAAVARAAARFVGEIEQVPPMHSALKHAGRPLYALARAGVEVERAPRRVSIRRIDIVEGQGDVWTLDIECSKGTYIRTLAQDLGAALGCGAHLQALRRTASGTSRLVDAVSLERLESMTEAERDAALRPPDALLADRPSVQLGSDDASRFLDGMRRRVQACDAGLVRVYGPLPRAAAGALRLADAPVFLGSGHVSAGELIPTRLLSAREVQGILPPAAQSEPQRLPT